MVCPPHMPKAFAETQTLNPALQTVRENDFPPLNHWCVYLFGAVMATALDNSFSTTWAPSTSQFFEI